MHDSDMADDRDKIKPGESLFTPAWRTATWKMTLEQRGFAQSAALMLMHLDGWQDIPDAETLAKGIPDLIIEELRP